MYKKEHETVLNRLVVCTTKCVKHKRFHSESTVFYVSTSVSKSSCSFQRLSSLTGEAPRGTENYSFLYDSPLHLPVPYNKCFYHRKFDTNSL